VNTDESSELILVSKLVLASESEAVPASELSEACSNKGGRGNTIPAISGEAGSKLKFRRLLGGVTEGSNSEIKA